MAEEFLNRLTIEGPDLSKTMDLPIGEFTIGRQEGNDLHLNHRLVSRVHAQIICTASTCQITDLGSANGTVVNGEKIEANAPVKLGSGAKIEIGPFEMNFEQIAVVPAKPKPEKPKKEPAKPKPKPPAPPPPSPPPPPVEDTRPPIDYSEPPPGLTRSDSRYLRYLPGIYHTDFMKRFLAIFESVLAPIEWNVDNFDLYLNPETTPSGFLTWLASWFSITFDSTWSTEQQRQLLTEAHAIFARRGTSWALSRVLEIYTGVEPEIKDVSSDDEPFIFEVTIPLNEKEVDGTLIEYIIDVNKPAHTNYKLSFKAKSGR